MTINTERGRQWSLPIFRGLLRLNRTRYKSLKHVKNTTTLKTQSSLDPEAVFICHHLITALLSESGVSMDTLIDLQLHAQQTVMLCVSWLLSIRTSMNISCRVNYSNHSVGSDHTDQPSFPKCIISEPWAKYSRSHIFPASNINSDDHLISPAH